MLFRSGLTFYNGGVANNILMSLDTNSNLKVSGTTTVGGTLTVSGGFILTPNTVTSNVTIPTGYNASFVGPMIVANNVIVSTANGSRLVIL